MVPSRVLGPVDPAQEMKTATMQEYNPHVGYLGYL